MSNNANRMKRIERAQMRAFFSVPFFAPGVAKLGVEFADTIAGQPVKTACTDGERIVFNPDFCDKLSDAELVTVLCHEVCHPMLGHMWRAPAGADWDVWNQATDHAVNLMLQEFSALVMAKNLADPFPFPKPQEAYCADPRFKGMAEEAIYAQLAAQNPSGGSGGGQGSGQGGKGAGKSNQSGGNPGKGSMPSFGQMANPANSAQQSTKSSAKQLQNSWQAVLLQSAKMAAGQGNLPGSMERLIDSIVKPKIAWTGILRSWLREQCADDWNWLAPAMEFEGSGFMLPSLKSDKIGTVVFGSDWSGSTFGELVEKFHVEKQSCLDDMRPAKLIDIGFDTRVLWEKEYACGDVIDKRIAGGGGTSFVDVLKRCEQLQPQPKAVVILTDLDGEFPKQAPPFPVVWVVYGNSSHAPFGEVIHAE